MYKKRFKKGKTCRSVVLNQLLLGLPTQVDFTSPIILDNSAQRNFDWKPYTIFVSLQQLFFSFQLF